MPTQLHCQHRSVDNSKILGSMQLQSFRVPLPYQHHSFRSCSHLRLTAAPGLSLHLDTSYSSARAIGGRRGIPADWSHTPLFLDLRQWFTIRRSHSFIHARAGTCLSQLTAAAMSLTPQATHLVPASLQSQNHAHHCSVWAVAAVCGVLAKASCSDRLL